MGRYANDDHLAFEFTPNFNNNAGRLPGRPQRPSTAASSGSGSAAATARNNAYFARPSAGAWHHYAFVLDTTAPAPHRSPPTSTAQPVAFTQDRKRHRRRQLRQLEPLLHVARRQRPVRRRALDEVAIYNRALRPATIAAHYCRHRRRQSALRRRPSPPRPTRSATGQTRRLQRLRPPPTPTARSPSTSGTSTATAPTRPTPGSTPTTSRTYAAAGNYDVGLRVTDNQGATATTTRAPYRAPTAPPTPPSRRPRTRSTPARRSAFNASGSTDPDGTIAKYEWDLDGNGTYETDTGTTATTSRSYASAGNRRTSSCG